MIPDEVSLCCFFSFLRQTWETRYILLLWMSIICMIPFDMAKLDSNAPIDEDGRKKEPTMIRIINVGKVSLVGQKGILMKQNISG